MHDESLPATGLTCHDMATSATAERTTSLPLTSSVAASPVSPTASPESAVEPTMTATCGLSIDALFATLDRSGLWRKTSQGYFQLTMDGSSEAYSATWPRSGTMRNGQCYRRAPWVPHIHANACSSWPTPNASDALGGGSARVGRGETTHQIRITDAYKARTGQQIPIWFVEWLMGFPEDWTKANESED